MVSEGQGRIRKAQRFDPDGARRHLSGRRQIELRSVQSAVRQQGAARGGEPEFQAGLQPADDKDPVHVVRPK